MIEVITRNILGTAIVVFISLMLFSKADGSAVYSPGDYFNYPIYVLAQVHVS